MIGRITRLLVGSMALLTLPNAAIAASALEEMVMYSQAALKKDGYSIGTVDGKCGANTRNVFDAYLTEEASSTFAHLSKEQFDEIRSTLCQLDFGVFAVFTHLQQKHGRIISDQLHFSVIDTKEVVLIEGACGKKMGISGHENHLRSFTIWWLGTFVQAWSAEGLEALVDKEDLRALKCYVSHL